MSFMHVTKGAAVGAALLLGAAAMATPAVARDRDHHDGDRDRGRHHHRIDPGAAAAAGIVTGTLGAIAGSQGYGRHYRDSDCRVIVDHHRNRWGERVTRRTRVCD